MPDDADLAVSGDCSHGFGDSTTYGEVLVGFGDDFGGLDAALFIRNAGEHNVVVEQVEEAFLVGDTEEEGFEGGLGFVV